ncbi:hypothetical protein EIP91_004618 [Steccherinum ochraceum]|uniref:Pet127-domain-containing protein n=1 Tax=Steccherinum ochraceum TaxID=92696 RepID=A0A4R0RZU4_9APHY|nr:hypothetical protein EIP91_004618 [Steccherinum ochraceum]
MSTIGLVSKTTALLWKASSSSANGARQFSQTLPSLASQRRSKKSQTKAVANASAALKFVTASNSVVKKKATRKRKRKSDEKKPLKPEAVLPPHLQKSEVSLLGPSWPYAKPGGSLEQEAPLKYTTQLENVDSKYLQNLPSSDSSFEPESPPHTEEKPPPPYPYSQTVSGTLDITKTPFGQDLKPPSEQRPIATLAHGLDRVLFNPGVHWLRDPRSRVYNFSPWLQTVPQLSTFDFDKVTGFIRSSRDDDLFKVALREKCQFAGSTSSVTGMLAQIYFLLSKFQPVNLRKLSKDFDHKANFTSGQKLPVSVILNYKDGVYLADSDKGDPSEMGSTVLSYMGTMLEKFLTVPKAEFQEYLRNADPSVMPHRDHRREAYRYAKFGSYVIRSQLDAQDTRLPGTGVFDIKTRAAKPLRLDPFNTEEGSGYLIKTLHGEFESFESEYHDLIRSAFLKYSFQARIGNMDGVLVTYHNTSQIFGFQYIPLEEMDEALYGNAAAGPEVFEACVRMMEAVTAEAIKLFPNQTVSCMWKTQEDDSHLRVFVEPTDWKPEYADQEKPIAQLDVEIRNSVGGVYVTEDVTSELAPQSWWDVDYYIHTVQESFDKIRARKQQLMEMSRRLYALPPGVSVEEMSKAWKTKQGIEGTFDPARFEDPNRYLKALRTKSRAGAEETSRLLREEYGKKKVIWKQVDGELEEWEQDVIEEGLASQHAATQVKDEPHTRRPLPDQLRLMGKFEEAIQRATKQKAASQMVDRVLAPRLISKKSSRRKLNKTAPPSRPTPPSRPSEVSTAPKSSSAAAPSTLALRLQQTESFRAQSLQNEIPANRIPPKLLVKNTIPNILSEDLVMASAKLYGGTLGTPY